VNGVAMLRRLVAWALPCCLLAGCDRPAAGAGAPAPAADGSPAAAAPGPGTGIEAVLARYLEAALDHVQSPACLRRDQDDWMARARSACGDDAACLDRARAGRARALEGLLPGAVLEAGAALDGADDADDGVRLLAVAGDPSDDDPADATTTVEGRPYEAEGGFLLVDDGFDEVAYAEFESLLGDEDALRERYGEAPVVFRGLRGALSAQPFDVGGLAAIDAVGARGGWLRVQGRPVEDVDGLPHFDGTGCVLVYGFDPGA
jgi:hypothetical protein